MRLIFSLFSGGLQTARMKCPFLSQLSGQFVRHYGAPLLRQFGEYCPRVQALGVNSTLDAIRAYSSNTSGASTLPPDHHVSAAVTPTSKILSLIIYIYIYYIYKAYAITPW